MGTISDSYSIYTKFDGSGYDGIIFIGDSRTYYMSNVDLIKNYDTNIRFICKSGMGYDWWISSAQPKLNKFLSQNSDKKYKIVMLLGVNDLSNVDKYITSFKNASESDSQNKWYFVSVNPTIEGMGHGASLNSICAFNAKVQKAVPSQYIDTYSAMMKTDILPLTDCITTMKRMNLFSLRF